MISYTIKGVALNRYPSFMCGLKRAVLVIEIFLALNSVCLSANPKDSSKLSLKELKSYQQAADYSKAHRGISMVIMRNGKIVFEDYPKGHSPEDSHRLRSGTKSFSSAIAICAIQDSLLSFDELVSETITEWKSDSVKSQITIRQLLSLTSGIDVGKTGTSLFHRKRKRPTYTESISFKMLHSPGTTFQYGPVPFQIFGEIMKRKLAALGETPHDYLIRCILNPIGLKVEKWLTDKDGNYRMPAGMFLTAREWAKYGQLILNGGEWEGKTILNKNLLSECTTGSWANPGYGITFWLPVQRGIGSKGESTLENVKKLEQLNAPKDIIKAAGVGGQKLYIIPSLNLVIVRQSTRRGLGRVGFNDAEFLTPILNYFCNDI